MATLLINPFSACWSAQASLVNTVGPATSPPPRSTDAMECPWTCCQFLGGQKLETRRDEMPMDCESVTTMKISGRAPVCRRLDVLLADAALDDVQGTTSANLMSSSRHHCIRPPAAALHREGQDAAALKASGLAQQTPSKSSKFELRVAPSLLAQQAPRASSSSAAQHC